MKSTWFGCRQRYNFARLLRESSNEEHYSTFRSFLTCSMGAMQQSVNHLIGNPDDDLERSIIREQQRCKSWHRLSDALGVLTLALEEQAYDFLGTVFMELGINDKNYRGQCFTPRAVSRCIAEMTFMDVSPSQERLTLQEPACGSGSMLIEASEVLKTKGFYPWNYEWTAIDVDWRCAAMTYIQTTLLGIPCTVVHGNTLTLETSGTYRNLIRTIH